MLTLDMLYALLQGLPADHLDFLDRPWYLLATRIQRALKEGHAPLAALRSALSASPQWERQSLPRASRLRRRGVFLRAFLQEGPVLALPVLWRTGFFFFRSPTRRCFSDASSLSQLSRILAQSLPRASRLRRRGDRSNTRRRLDVLIEKGYAAKYFRRDGAYYLAISSPLDQAAKSQITDLMQAFKQALLSAEKETLSNGEPQPQPHATTPTTSTKPTPPTRVTRESSITSPTIATRLPRPP